MGGDFSLRGGTMIRPKAGFFLRFCVKIVWTTLRKRSKNMFFAGENRISKRKTSKFSRLRRGYTPSSPNFFARLRRGYYPSNYSNHNYPDDVLRKVIIRKQLFRWRCPNTIIQMQLFRWRCSKAIIYMTLLKSNYSKNNYSNIIHEAATTQAIFKFTCGYRTLYTCMHKTFGKEKICAAGAIFFLIQELKRPFLVRKTW